MTQMLLRFAIDDAGEDLIEYALLVTFIGLSCLAAWDAIEAALGNAYGVFDNSSQGLACPPLADGNPDPQCPFP